MTSSRGIVVVTGASAGAGRATVRAFAERGYDVALLARGRAGLDAAAAEVRAEGRRALVVETDVAHHEEVDAAARAVEAELGEIDVWVNNAMTTIFAPSWDCAPEDFRRAVEVTFLGQVWGTMAALRTMRPRDRGAVVNVGSALAFLGIPLQSAYCSAKFASRGFFESVRAELLHEGSAVRLSMVHLPAVDTPQFGWCRTSLPGHPQPVPPIYRPELCAKVIVDTALDGRRERMIGTWNRLLITGGRLVPGFGNQFASIAAWESQLTDEGPGPDERGDNLYRPVDADTDVGAHGIFADRSGGVLDPSFLVSLPTIATQVVRATARTLTGKAAVLGRAARRRAGQSR